MRRKKLLLSLGVFVVAALLAEAGLRVWLRIEGRPYSKRQAVEAIAGIEEFASNYSEVDPGRSGEFHRYRGRDQIHPFFAFDAPESRDLPIWYLDLQDRSRREITVLISGGSVANAFGREGTDRLAELLESDPRLQGRSVRFLRFGHAAYKQPQQLTQLAYLMSLGLRPDVVLEISGFNEVAIGNHNGVVGAHPTFPARDKWLTLTIDIAEDPQIVAQGARLITDRLELLDRCIASRTSPMLSSAVLAHVLLARLEAGRGDLTRRSQEYLETLEQREIPEHLLGPTFEGDAHACARTVVDHWFESSVSMQALCESRGASFLQVLQPAMHLAGSKQLTQTEINRSRISPYWRTGVELGYPLLRKRGLELRERGAAFLDATQVFADIEETIYIDPVHFSPRGAEILAERIAPALFELIEE